MEIILVSAIEILLFALSVISLRTNSKSPTNRYFSSLCIAIALWIIFSFLENEIKIFNVARILLFLDFFLGVFMVYLFFILILNLTNSPLIKYKRYLFWYTVFIDCLLIANLVIVNIRFLDGAIVFDAGSLYYLYALQPFFLTISSVVIFIRSYVKSSGLYKMQLRYSLLGLIISGFIILFTTQILPQFGINDIRIQRLGIYGLIFFIGFTSYAILRYRLMDIRVIVRRSAVFTLLVLLITAVYALFAFLISIFFTELIGVQSVVINGILTAVFVAVGFEPLKITLSKITDRFLFKAEYQPQQVLAEFAERLSSTLDLDVVSSFLTKRLAEIFKAQFVSLFLLNTKNGKYQRQAATGQATKELLVIDEKLFSRIYNHLKEYHLERDIFVKEELKKNLDQTKNPILELYYDELDSYGVNLVVPLYNQETLIGILFLGDKKSGDVYGAEDIRVLEIISAQSAVAMQNAKLYEEQIHFADHLKDEVNKATKELKVANVQLKKLDEAKSEFISIASHQLRTPLTVIKGYLSMINQGDFGPVPPAIINPLDKVSKSTARIIGLVEDLLNISRIESGRLKYDFEKVDFVELVKEVFEELEQHAKSRGLRFEFVKPQAKLPSIVIDRSKIREVIMNLMDNAIKYTEKGFVRVNITKDGGYLVYSVTDSGRGLELDDMSMLFQKFSRAKGVQLVHTEGTGLGLYIAKQMVTKHNGEIGATSQGKDKGSTFWIKFKIDNAKLAKAGEKK